MKVYGLMIALALTAFSACESKTEAPVEPQAQAEPAALAKAPAVETKPKTHLRLENVKTKVDLKKLNPKNAKAPRQVNLNGDDSEKNESTAE